VLHPAASSPRDTVAAASTRREKEERRRFIMGRGSVMTDACGRVYAS
jgi:hypothetical protein